MANFDPAGWKSVLNQQQVEIVQELTKDNIDDIVRGLQAKGVISVSEKQNFELNNTQRIRAYELIDKIQTKSDDQFLIFLDVLRSKEVGKENLAEKIEAWIREKSGNIEQRLAELESPPQDEPNKSMEEAIEYDLC